MKIFRKLNRNLREFPAAVLLCFITAVAVTVKYSSLALSEGRIDMVFYIAMYGYIASVLIFSLGVYISNERIEKKQEERRRFIRICRAGILNSREFYGITEEIGIRKDCS